MPALPPPDAEKTEVSTTRVGRVESVFVDIADAASAVVSNNPVKAALGTAGAGAGVGAVTPSGAATGAGAGTGSATGAGAGAGSVGRASGARSTTGKDAPGTRAPGGSSVQENQRVVPGMWWTVRQEGTPKEREGLESAEWIAAGRGESLVVQGWEEVDGFSDDALWL